VNFVKLVNHPNLKLQLVSNSFLVTVCFVSDGSLSGSFVRHRHLTIIVMYLKC